MPWDSAGSARTGWVSSSPLARATVRAGCSDRWLRCWPPAANTFPIWTCCAPGPGSSTSCLQTRPCRASSNAPYGTLNPELFGYGFETLTRQLRSKAWEAAGPRNLALLATAAAPLVIDLNATLVTSHSDKELVAGTHKGGYGFAPFIASCDHCTNSGTGEILAARLRPGNAQANSADDHISVFETALSQLPKAFFTDTGEPAGQKILIRDDSAGASRKFLWYLHARGIQFSVWYPGAAGQSAHDRLDQRQTVLAAGSGPGRQ